MENDEKDPLAEERQAYLQKMQEDRGYLLDFHRILAQEDLPFLKNYDGLLQAAYLDPAKLADKKTRELILIAILVSVRSTREHIRTHIALVKEMGATRKEVLEVIEMCLPPAGLPAFMQGFDIWREVYEA